ncbi:MAG TPA: membrane protein insertion efficiency factor YidD [Candidatus Aquilonibacter sp.]|nr:membrane protein insertion efficiency factor YidD [Candidatus Aquilonibacter sp.]
MRGQPRSIGAWALLFLLRIYMALLAPLVGGACKFYPSCSNYAYEAVARHGARRGGALAIQRLLRCNPFTKGGVDLVPDELPDRQGLKPPAGGGTDATADAATYKAGAEPAANLREVELRL